MSTIVFFDLEFTSWQQSVADGWAGPNHFREVTQIGAVRFDPQSMTVVDQFNCLVRPHLNPLISEYNLVLTGLQQADIDRAESLAEVYPSFVRFVGEDIALAYGWDVLVLIESALLHGMDCWGRLDGVELWLDLAKEGGVWPPSIPASHRVPQTNARTIRRYGANRTRETSFSQDPQSIIEMTMKGLVVKTRNLRPWFAARGVPTDHYSSGQIHQYLGIPLEGHVHNALFDAHSLAISCVTMQRRDQEAVRA